jgi:hypothetical protein
MIRRYIAWRNRNAHDKRLREIVNRQTLPEGALVARGPLRIKRLHWAVFTNVPRRPVLGPLRAPPPGGPSTLPRLPRIVATVGWSGPRVVLADRQRPLLLRLGPGQIPKVLDLSRLAKLRGDRSQVAAIDH